MKQVKKSNKKYFRYNFLHTITLKSFLHVHLEELNNK